MLISETPISLLAIRFPQWWHWEVRSSLALTVVPIEGFLSKGSRKQCSFPAKCCLLLACESFDKTWCFSKNQRNPNDPPSPFIHLCLSPSGSTEQNNHQILKTRSHRNHAHWVHCPYIHGHRMAACPSEQLHVHPEKPLMRKKTPTACTNPEGVISEGVHTDNIGKV